MNRKHRQKPAPGRGRPAGRRASPQDLWLYGRHAVAAALANPARQCRLLLATTDALRDLEQDQPLSPDLAVETVERHEIDRRLPSGAVHQGLALQAEPLDEIDLKSASYGKDLILILDQVQDPHNIGAILRSAAVFGAAAVVVQERHSPAATGALAKSASGALEKVPVVRVVNLARALDELKDLGFWVVGLDAEGPESLDRIAKDQRIALVLGAEGAGLRRLSREACDVLAKIPHAGGMASLNVSNAAAVALYVVRAAMAV